MAESGGLADGLLRFVGMEWALNLGQNLVDAWIWVGPYQVQDNEYLGFGSGHSPNLRVDPYGKLTTTGTSLSFYIFFALLILLVRDISI